MKFDKDILIKYQELKESIEEKAEEVLKAYYKFKQWRFPGDFSLDDVTIISKDKVCINYYGFQDHDCEYIPMDYFLTLDSKYLNDN